jgi:glycosyltransferase involved in cell wall biosynthesis
MQQRSVSVIIPTFNRKDLLTRTIDSVLANTGDIDIVVCDDGSTDGTEELMREYEQFDSKIRYVRQEHQGFGAAKARNAGAYAAQGDFLLFLDAGMVIAPSTISTYLAKVPLDVVGVGPSHGHYAHHGKDLGLSIDDLTRLAISHKEYADPRFNEHALFWDKIPWFQGWSCNLFLSKDTFWNTGAFDERFVSYGLEDLEFAYRCYRQGHMIQRVDEAWAFHLPRRTTYREKSVGQSVNIKLIYPGMYCTWDWELVAASLARPGALEICALRHHGRSTEVDAKALGSSDPVILSWDSPMDEGFDLIGIALPLATGSRDAIVLRGPVYGVLSDATLQQIVEECHRVATRRVFAEGVTDVGRLKSLGVVPV